MVRAIRSWTLLICKINPTLLLHLIRLQQREDSGHGPDKRWSNV